jgi:hypothetical protein
MNSISSRKDKLVTVILKDGTSCSGKLFMTVSTANKDAGVPQAKKFIYLQVGESSKVVRFNVSDIEEVSAMAGSRAV